MEGLVYHTPMIDCIRERGFFQGCPFVLIDVGCSGGIDHVYRNYGPTLIAHGYDPNITSCDEAHAREKFRNVHYHPRFVGLPPTHPFVQHCKAEAQRWENPNPWDRITAGYMAAKERAAAKNKPSMPTRWADPSTIIGVAEIVAEEKLPTVDFLKVDVDGPDLEVLESARPIFDAQQVLAVGLEVNWIGTASRACHTFHNTDLFLREQGYTLFGLTSRPYSRTALPAPFQMECYAQTRFGQPYQGDAIYIRDLVAPHEKARAASYPAEKLLKLACIYEMCGLPDCAAEVLVHFTSRLAAFGNVEELLDAVTPPLLGQKLSYREYIAKFENEPHLFLPSAQKTLDDQHAAAHEKSTKQQWLHQMLAARGSVLRRIGRRVKRMVGRAARMVGAR